MRLALRSADRALDVVVTGADDTVTVADLFAAAGLGCSGPVIADGFRCDPSTPLAALDLAEGAVVVSADAPATDDGRRSKFAGDVVARLVGVSGVGAGRRVDLVAGTFDLRQVPSGPADRGQGEGLFRIVVGADGSVRLGGLGTGPVVVDGEVIDEELTSGSLVAVGNSVFRVESMRPDRSKPAVTTGGRSVFVRPPRVIEPLVTDAVVAPKPPPEPRTPEPLSILLLLLPIPVGIAMAFFLSPFFLLFTLMSPILGVGRHVDGKRRARRSRAANEAQMAADLTAFVTDLDAQRSVAAEHARRARHDLARLADVARTGAPELWRSRPGHPDFLRPVIGVGDTRWEPEILGQLATPGLQAAAADAAVLPMTPVTADLAGGIALGIVGPPEARRRLAAAVVAGLVVEHGPGDVELGALLDPDSVVSWDHLKWLPHIVDHTGALRVSLTIDDAEQLVARVLPEPVSTTAGFGRPKDSFDGPVPVFVVDAADVLLAGVRPLASRFPRLTGRALILADTTEELPSFCTTYASIDRSTGEVVLVDVAGGTASSGIVPAYAHRGTVSELSRSLARFVDPDSPAGAATLPDLCYLTDILPVDTTAEALERAWADPPRGCRSVLGVADNGPLDIEFLRDGPHALVAGTTGAGKSELLRSMIVSLAAHYGPDRVTFVLVDFKGGGAFDVFADLPHNVGVVTDLDEHLSARALRCLQAELKYREHRLRDAGVSDLVDLPPGGEPLPRLLIVVDEFATLAAELPDFMTSLVDVAQRGRSLGIHMVLATQRPAGVIDAKIKANTNLRIALRVQDDADSIDVIGGRAAAEIDRRFPGRAFARFGASELVGFQTALVSVQPRNSTGPALHLDVFDLSPQARSGGDGPVFDGDGPDDLATYVAAARRAAEALGLPAPRVPWPDPLPTALAAEDLVTAEPAVRWATPFGLADLPDQQCQLSAWWRASEGNLVVYGIEPGAASGVVTTIALGLATRHDADAYHLYVIDFAGSLSALRALPHTGGYVGADDDERLLRTLQLLENELDRRRRLVTEAQVERIGPDVDLGEATPLITVAIASYGAVLEAFEELGELGAPARLAQVVRDGPALGVVVMIASTSERDVPNRVAQTVEAKLVMRMADPNAYLMFGLKAREVPDLVTGRAIDARTKLELHVARFADGDARAAVEQGRWRAGERGPTPVEILGTDIEASALAGHSRAGDRVWHLSLGIDHDGLQPLGLDLRSGRHVVVTGPSGSGKTSTLQALAVAARASDPDAYVAVVSGRPEEWDPLRAELDLTTVEFLMSDESDESPGRRTVIIVDGIESATVPTEVFDTLAARPPDGIHLAVSGRGESFRAPDPWVRSVISHRTGVALQASPEMGDVFRCRFPTPKGPVPAGRGYVVNEGIPTLAQIARHRPSPAPTATAAG